MLPKLLILCSDLKILQAEAAVCTHTLGFHTSLYALHALGLHLLAAKAAICTHTLGMHPSLYALHAIYVLSPSDRTLPCRL